MLAIIMFSLSQAALFLPLGDQSLPSILHALPAGSQPTAKEIAHLRSEHFFQVNEVKEFPSTCKKAFAALTGESTFSLANPGQAFQATDMIAPGPRLPWRRLIVGGTTSSHCVIYYEKGGFATSYAAVIFDISRADTPAFVWGGVGGGAVHDVRALIDLITQGAFKQGGRNGW